MGLNIAVFIAEKDNSSSWKDYDEEVSENTMAANSLNALASVAYFTAFFFKSKNPVVSAVGAALMTGTVGGAAVLEGVVFKHQYDLQKRIAINSGPPF